MRTPSKARKGGPVRKGAGNKLRKKAMKNKTLKKSMFTLAGDTTKDEIADLINDSAISNISIIGRSPSRVSTPKTRSTPKTKSRTPSRRASGGRTPTRSSTKKEGQAAKTLRSLGSQISLKAMGSMRLKKSQPYSPENGVPSASPANGLPSDSPIGNKNPEKRVRHVTNLDGNGEIVEATNISSSENPSRIRQLANMLTNAVYGVQYGKLAEEEDKKETHEANVSSSQQQATCIIS